MTNHSHSQSPDTAFALIRTALPIGAFYLTEILVGLTDLAVVGALGTTELAAGGLGKTIILSVMVVGFAVLSIGTIQMAERPTAARCGAVVVASVIVALAFVAAAILTAQVSPSILSKSGYEIELVGAFESYTHILAWAIAPALCIGIFKNVLNARQTTGLITWLSIRIVLGEPRDQHSLRSRRWLLAGVGRRRRRLGDLVGQCHRSGSSFFDRAALRRSQGRGIVCPAQLVSRL